MSCDLDGDGRQDLVLLNDAHLAVCYQMAGGGFAPEPQLTWHLDRRPSVVWVAKLGGLAASVLVMTSDGITEICLTNRTGPPLLRQTIRQATIIPEAASGTNVMCFPFSAKTDRGWPLLLVPSPEGLQVWEHREEWRKEQLIQYAFVAGVRPSASPGYGVSVGLDLSVGDVNGDGRDDLIIRRSIGWTNCYSLYLQQTNGLFAPDPALTFGDQMQLSSWHCWIDLNRDGQVDLIRSVWLHESSFAPGMPSGKVLVNVFLNDESGRMPAEPAQIFRKYDWNPALPVVDVDGDGFPDLVLGYSLMDTREGLRKEITAKQLDYTLRIHCYRPGTGFPKEADCQRAVVIRLDNPALILKADPHLFFERFVSLDGDFNGDGRRDLLVREHGDDISVYFFISRQEGFSRKPDLRFICPELFDEWQVADLNNDAMSDLIVKLAKENSLRVFVSPK